MLLNKLLALIISSALEEKPLAEDKPSNNGDVTLCVNIIIFLHSSDK